MYLVVGIFEQKFDHDRIGLVGREVDWAASVAFVVETGGGSTL